MPNKGSVVRLPFSPFPDELFVVVTMHQPSDDEYFPHLILRPKHYVSGKIQDWLRVPVFAVQIVSL